MNKEQIKEKQMKLLGNDYANYEVERLIEHIIMLEEKLGKALEYEERYGLSQEEALSSMDKDEFVEWAIDMTNIYSFDIVVIDQEKVKEFEDEWEEHREEEE